MWRKRQYEVREHRTNIFPKTTPAVADFEVTTALKAAGDALSEDVDGKRCHVGVVHSKDSFYGEIEPLQMPVGDKLSDSWAAYVKCGCLTSEMESAAIFSVALARRKNVQALYSQPSGTSKEATQDFPILSVWTATER